MTTNTDNTHIVMPEDFEPNSKPAKQLGNYIKAGLDNPGRWIKFNLDDLSAAVSTVRVNASARSKRYPSEHWSVSHKAKDDFLYIRCIIEEES